MRTFACAISACLLLLGAPPWAGASGPIPGRLESVSILAAGQGASLAVRTSSVAALVATTAADPRTVVIELLGIAGRRRALSVADGPGMISHIAIDTVGPPATGAVTRVRVSLAGPFRHRMRTSGHLVYVDFERIEGGPTRGLTPTPARGLTPMPARDLTPMPVRGADPLERPRWSAVAAPLRHAVGPPAAATVLRRSWMPLVLNDGTIILSHGDQTEVNEQLTFLLPFEDSDAPRVEAVSLARSVVDLEATARAAESVRAARYAVAAGPREFAALSEEVSAMLGTVASVAHPVARVNIVEAARRRLVEWPAAHHGYRIGDIRDAVSLLDPILAQLRAEAGINGVEVTLATPTYTTPPATTVRQPTLVDLIENAMRAVTLLAVPAERTAVLRATAAALNRFRAELPADWFSTRQRSVAAALDNETRVDEAYRKLSEGLMARAARAERDGDVRAVAALQSELLERDRELGRQRQDVLTATMAALQAHFANAAQAQLLRDRRELGAEVVRAYVQAIDPALKRFDDVQGELRQMARTAVAPARRDDLRDAIEFVLRVLIGQRPPPQVEDAHNVMLAAVQQAGDAIRGPVDASLVARSIETFERGRLAIEASTRR